MTHVAPSILSANFARLGDEVAAVERGGADRIHVDVMDGHFVPNLSMGPAVVKSLRPVTKLPLEVHLMVTDPGKFTNAFTKAGADRLLAQVETLHEPMSWVRAVRATGKSAGLVVNPETPVERLETFLEHIDLALCMTVHPGFGGQAFLPESPGRIARLRKIIDQINPACELEVDGGVDAETAATCVACGATVLVAGSHIFGHAAGAEAATRDLVRRFV